MREVVIGNATLYHGDCLEVMAGLPDASVDSIVTDPPYGLSFMGKRWDYDVPSVDVWAECLRVLKPGGHLLAFAGTRTQHRMAARIEDAGFEIRDMIAWVYGSGFPKSLDVSKAIDKAAGCERTERLAPKPGHEEFVGRDNLRSLRESGALAGDGGYSRPWMHDPKKVEDAHWQFAPATDAARQWEGWGTALKPALEPITVARKPLEGTVAANVLAHGTGALNIDGCRVESGESTVRTRTVGDLGRFNDDGWQPTPGTNGSDAGRWPANLIHDGSDEVVALFPETSSGKAAASGHKRSGSLHDTESGWGMRHEESAGLLYGDSGSAARFFYCAKASKRDREEGLDGFEEKPANSAYGDGLNTATKVRTDQQAESGVSRGLRRNHHPTVKPTDLMRYLCRLVTPPGGVVLDPFMGSGSTGKAALREEFRFIGIEREPKYFEIACRRIEDAQRQGRMFE